MERRDFFKVCAGGIAGVLIGRPTARAEPVVRVNVPGFEGDAEVQKWLRCLEDAASERLTRYPLHLYPAWEWTGTECRPVRREELYPVDEQYRDEYEAAMQRSVARDMQETMRRLAGKVSVP